MKDSREESQVRLRHMQSAIHAIQKYVTSLSEEDFQKSEIVVDAVLLQFSILGEAVNHIEERILLKYHYPWYKVRSFRNLTSHEYFNIKLPAVWQIITNDLPELRAIIESIIEEEFK